MGLALFVNGKKVNFELTEREVRAYDFIYSAPNSKKSKASEDERYLKITGDISRIIEKNNAVLELIRRWAKSEYTDDTYFNHVKITETYNDSIIREITFPEAFIKQYTEGIDPHTGHGYFTLLLMQKLDKKTDIIIDPFNEKFPTLYDLTDPDSDINKLAAITGLSAAAAAALLLNSDLYALAGIEGFLNGTCIGSKDPVNLATGNLVYASTDLTIGGAFPLRFYRFYNAIDEYNGALGFNWHHAFEIKMAELEDGVKEIIFEDGHREKYTPDKKGGFVPPAGVHKRLYTDYDEETGSRKYVLKLLNSTKFEFNEQGRVTVKTDANGNPTEFSYTAGLLTGVSAPSGSLSFAYSSEGLIEAISDHAGRKAIFRYADGNLRSVTDTDGRTFTYSYDKSTNRLASVTNPLGNTMLYNSYDGAARTTHQAFPDGGRMKYTYSDKALTTNLTERNGNKIVYHYDKDYRIYKEEFQDGCIEKIFDSDNNIIRQTDKMGNAWNYEYNGNGRKIKETDPLGNVTEYRYGLANKLTKTIKPNGAEITYKYDSKGNLIAKVDELGNELKIQYNEAGLPVVLVNERSHELSCAYDERGNRITETDALENTSAYEYDGLNRLIKVAYPEGNTRAFEYTESGKVQKVFDGYGSAMEYTYDSADNIIEIKDFNGGKTTFKYNEMNRLVKKMDVLGNTRLYEYDHMWNVIRETDENGNARSYEYDDMNRLAAETDEEGNRTEYTYDKNGNRTVETDALGQTTKYRYDRLNRKTETVNKESAKSAIEYDAVGNTVRTTDYMGNETGFEYDLKGRLLTKTDALGGQTAYTYDEAGNRLSVTDPMGGVTRYEYNAKNKVIAVINPINGRAEAAYNKNGNISQIIDSEGGKTTYSYDKNDRLTGFTNPEGYSYTFKYDANGNRTAITDARNNRRVFEYDALNRRTAMTDEGGCTSTVEYDPAGRIIKAVNAEGAVTRYDYDRTGNITKVTDALGNVTNLEYDALNRLIKKIEPNGAETVIEYTPMSLVSAVTNADGGARRFEYDKNGRMTKAANEEGEIQTYEYNALGHVIKAADPLGHSDAFAYDANSRITSVTDKNGNKTSYKYDGNGNIVETIDALGRSSYFEYDTLNRLVKMRLYRIDDKNPAGEEQVTLYQYDGRGLVTKVINALGYEKLMIYDENGNLIQKTDEDGYVTAYSYNSKNLVKLINYSDEKKVMFEYNKMGKLTAMDDWTGNTTFELDMLNRIVSVNDHNNKVVKYAYDETGNQTCIDYPDNTSVKYDYDLMKRMTNVIEEDGGVTSYKYDKSGRKISMLYPNRHLEKYFYDGIGQLTKVTASENGKPEYVLNKYDYDPQGNVIHEFKRDMMGSEHQSIDYGYDELNRLVRAEEGHGYFNRRYGYDSLGNMITENDNNMATSYGVDILNRLTSKKAGKDEVHNYLYDKRGNLVQETAATNNAVLAAYVYDATNRMVKGTNKDGESSAYRYNGLNVLVGNIDKANKDYVIDYTYPIPRELLEYRDGMDFKYVYSGRNHLSVDIKNGVDDMKLFYHNDRLGSVVFAADNDDKVKARTIHDEWGNISSSTVIQTGNGYADLFKNYTGHRFDDVLGVYYAKARLYDLSHKRFLSSDFIKGNIFTPQSLVNYSYVDGNPLSYLDPNGLEKVGLREYAEAYGANVTWNNKTKKATVEYNGITQEYTAKYYENADGRIQIDDLILDRAFGFDKWTPYNTAIDAIDELNSLNISPAAYSHIMNLTYHWYLTDDKKSKTIYAGWLNCFASNDFATTEGQFPSVDDNIAYMSTLPTGGVITQEQHYFRNNLNLNFSWAEYEKMQERLPNDMRWKDNIAASYHQNNTVNDEPNRKYVSFDGHFELVFNGDNALQTQYNNSDDMGTYNYYDPDADGVGHAIYDVEPYGLIPGMIKWGNVPNI